MKIYWKTLLVRITIWLVLEIGLNFLGLDSLADYSEFRRLSINRAKSAVKPKTLSG